MLGTHRISHYFVFFISKWIFFFFFTCKPCCIVPVDVRQMVIRIAPGEKFWFFRLGVRTSKNFWLAALCACLCVCVCVFMIAVSTLIQWLSDRGMHDFKLFEPGENADFEFVLNRGHEEKLAVLALALAGPDSTSYEPHLRSPEQLQSRRSYLTHQLDLLASNGAQVSPTMDDPFIREGLYVSESLPAPRQDAPSDLALQAAPVRMEIDMGAELDAGFPRAATSSICSSSFTSPAEEKSSPSHAGKHPLILPGEDLLDATERVLVVAVDSDRAINVKVLGELLVIFRQLFIDRVVLFVEKKLTNGALSLANDTDVILEALMLPFRNIVNHRLVPAHRRLSLPETQAVLAKYPKIRGKIPPTDVVALYYGFPLEALIELRMFNDATGYLIDYRFVSN